MVQCATSAYIRRFVNGFRTLGLSKIDGVDLSFMHYILKTLTLSGHKTHMPNVCLYHLCDINTFSYDFLMDIKCCFISPNTLRPGHNGYRFTDNIFKMHFFWKLLYFEGASLQYSNTVSANGLVLNRRQAIVWINECSVYSRMYISLALDTVYPKNMHTVLLCFALLWLCNRS